MTGGGELTLVFDLGGVLIDWNPRHLYRKIFDDPDEMEWFLSEVCHPQWNLRQDAGRPFAEAVAEKQAEHPDYAEAVAAYFGRWPEMLGGIHEGNLAILEEVRARGRPFFALTNWSGETYPVAQERFEFLEWFHGIVVSGHEGVVKPDAAIYDCLLDRYGLMPERTVFIDDSLANVDGARQRGMIGVHFTDAKTLRRELVELGALGQP